MSKKRKEDEEKCRKFFQKQVQPEVSSQQFKVTILHYLSQLSIMYRFKAFKAIAIVSLMTSTLAFFSSQATSQSNLMRPRSSSPKLLMMSSDIKRKPSVTPIIPAADAPSESVLLFPFLQLSEIGSGNDERISMSVTDQEIIESIQITTLRKSFLQNLLKDKLMSNSIGSMEKITRINIAASVQDILPNTFSMDVSKVLNIYGGGLMDDWNEIEF